MKSIKDSLGIKTSASRSGRYELNRKPKSMVAQNGVDGSRRRSGGAEEDEIVTKLSDIVGSWGPWQRNLFIFFFFGAMCSCFHSLALSFYAPNLEHWCAKPEWGSYQNMSIAEWKNLTFGTELQCFEMNDTSRKCHQEYDHSFYKRTIISEWDIVCDREFLASSTQSVYMAGVMVTVVVMGQLSDKIGRRPVIWAGLFIELAAGLSCAFSVSITHYLISRFWLAFGASARWGTGFVLILETVGPKYRAVVGMAIEFGWALGYIVMPGVAYILRDFRYLQLACTLPEFLLLAWWWTLPESPRWQLTHGKVDEAEASIRKAARINGKCSTTIDRKIAKLKDKIESERQFELEMKSNKKASLLDLMKTAAIRKYTLILFVTWFTNAFVYYGLSLNTNNLGGNPFINFLLAGAVEFPAYILSIYALRIVGRKLSVSLALFGGGLGCLATVPITNESLLWLKITFAMVGKFCITCSFGMIYVYTAELYPTVVRNVGVGASSMVGRIGSIMAPFVKELGKYTHPSVPLAAFGVLSLGDGLLILMLPETKGKEIPDTIDEAERIANKPLVEQSSSDSQSDTSSTKNS